MIKKELIMNLYDGITKMTNDEAASILSNMINNITMARGNGKSIQSLKTEWAILMAIRALKGPGASLSIGELRILANAMEDPNVTPNMVREFVGLEPVTYTDYQLRIFDDSLKNK
jgi:hypothetical protein